MRLKKKFFGITLLFILSFIFLVGFSQSVERVKNLLAENISFSEKDNSVDWNALYSYVRDKEAELKIEAYLKSKSMPLHTKSSKFVEVARKYNLDPFLLPAIAINESTGGKFLFKPFNPFGFGRKKFSSFDEAIEYVGHKLANGNYYKGKTLEKKLTTYNSVNKDYVSDTYRNMKNINNQKIDKIDPNLFIDSFKIKKPDQLKETTM